MCIRDRSVPLLVRQFGGAISSTVHRFGQGHEGVIRLSKDAATLLDVVAIKTHNNRLGGAVSEELQRADDALGHSVTRGDAAEHIDEHALDLLVAEDDIEAIGHYLCRSAAADVQEVGGFDAAMLFACIRDNVER